MFISLVLHFWDHGGRLHLSFYVWSLGNMWSTNDVSDWLCVFAFTLWMSAWSKMFSMAGCLQLMATHDKERLELSSTEPPKAGSFYSTYIYILLNIYEWYSTTSLSTIVEFKRADDPLKDNTRFPGNRKFWNHCPPPKLLWVLITSSAP